MDDQTDRGQLSDFPGAARFTRGELECVRVDSPAGILEAAIQGAHLLTWNPPGQKPVLFMSDRALFKTGKAVRGGVPIVFPWFGAKADDPSAPAHGFARTAPWRLLKGGMIDDKAGLQFELTNKDVHQTAGWSHPFLAHLDVSASDVLALRFAVQNTGDSPLPFEAAFHTYFSVSDARDVHVSGLEMTEYLDKPTGYTRNKQGAAPIRIEGEVDRVYINTPATCTIVDPTWRRRIVIAKSGSLATVVWNPGLDRAREFSDLGEEQWQHMICVETAIASENRIAIAPGELHELVATIRVEPF